MNNQPVFASYAERSAWLNQRVVQQAVIATNKLRLNRDQVLVQETIQTTVNWINQGRVDVSTSTRSYHYYETDPGWPA